MVLACWMSAVHHVSVMDGVQTLYETRHPYMLVSYSMSQQAMWSSAYQDIKEKQCLVFFHFHSELHVDVDTARMSEEILKLAITGQRGSPTITQSFRL